MSNSPLLLEGKIEDQRDGADDSARKAIDHLARQLWDFQQRLTKLEQENAILLKLLSPFYKALRPVFGDAEPLADLADGGASRNAGIWDGIKQRLAPRMQEAIDVLLLQKTMKRTQLASALKMDYSNCTKNVISPLIRQGWIVENGGNLSLKQL